MGGDHEGFGAILGAGRGAATLLVLAGPTRAQLLITGNDEKVSFDENGKTIRHPAGKDTVSIIDIADPVKPRILANLPLMNTITGPPVNLAITPDRHLALVANSLDWVKDGGDWKGVPDNKIYVIDLTASPPAQITTIEVGKQASTMAINRAGNLGAGGQLRGGFGHGASDHAKSVRLSARGRHSARCIGRRAAPGAPRCRCDHA